MDMQNSVAADRTCLPLNNRIYGSFLVSKGILRKNRRINMLEIDLPLKELDESLKRYVDAKLKVETYQKRLYEEAENMFPHFIKYARAEQEEKQTNLPSIMDNFYCEVLGLSCGPQDRLVRSSLTRRFKKLMKNHISYNPRYQKKLDGFMGEERLSSIPTSP